MKAAFGRFGYGTGTLYKYEYIIKMENGRIWIKKPESMQALVNVESEMFYY